MQVHKFTKLTRCSVRLLKSRYYSTTNKLVNITKNENDISVVSLNRAPVNGLNLELLSDLKESLEYAQQDKSRGIILTSSLPTIFCGGLDIMEMYKPNLERAAKFWTTLQDTWLTLYNLGLPVVAAINGASPAGGCLLAMGCEYRIFVDGKHTIGLNETKLGIIAPSWFQEAYVATIGYRAAELALLRGDLFSPGKAVEIGLVDELASDKNDALAKAEKYIEFYENISSAARARTKALLRQSLIEKLTKNREEDTSIFVKTISHPSVQSGLGLYIESLKKKKN